MTIFILSFMKILTITAKIKFGAKNNNIYKFYERTNDVYLVSYTYNEILNLHSTCDQFDTV